MLHLRSYLLCEPSPGYMWAVIFIFYKRFLVLRGALQFVPMVSNSIHTEFHLLIDVKERGKQKPCP